MDVSFGEVDWENIDDSHDPEQYIEYLESVSDTQWAKEAKEYSYRAIRPNEGDRILDLGCGIGVDVDGLAEYVGETGTVVGADKSESMVEEARKRYGDRENTRFVTDDATELSFSRDEFDRSRTSRVLQHVSRPKVAIQELKRVTRSGGLIWAVEPDWEMYLLDAPNSEIGSDIMDPQFVPVQHPSIGRKLYRLFSESGFDDIEANAHTVTIADAEKATLSFRLKTRLKAMIETGLISQDEAEQWLLEIRQASEKEQFLAAGTAFTVVARVPDRTG